MARDALTRTGGPEGRRLISVSLPGDTLDKVKAVATELGESASGFVAKATAQRVTRELLALERRANRAA